MKYLKYPEWFVKCNKIDSCQKYKLPIIRDVFDYCCHQYTHLQTYLHTYILMVIGNNMTKILFGRQ